MLLSSVAVSQGPARPDPPKANDATRVGVVTPRVSLLGGGGSVAQEATSLQKNIRSFLTGPRIGTVDLMAKLDSLALEEGKERQCDYVLFVSLVRKRQSAARGSGGYGGGTKAGDEFTFEYKIVATDGKQPPATRVVRATASADGEDVLTAMIETTAQAVVSLAKVARPAQPPQIVAEAKPQVINEPVKPEGRVPAPVESTPTGYGSLSATPPKRTNSPVRNDPPKAEGAIRIGIVIPKVTSTGGNMRGSNEASSLREAFVAYLEGSSIEILELKARLDNLALNESQKRACDFVLYTTMSRKRGSTSTGGGTLNSIMGNVGSGVGSNIPGSKTVGDITSGAARVTGSLATLARKNDEITFEYKLVTSAGARLVAGKVTKAKVKADGEDVLTPMIESAAQAILEATTVKN
jgi:hypothetical protein